MGDFLKREERAWMRRKNHEGRKLVAQVLRLTPMPCQSVVTVFIEISEVSDVDWVGVWETM